MNESKKIVFIIPRPKIGGDSQVLLNLFRHVEKKYSFFFLYNDPHGPLFNEFSRYGKVFYFPLDRNVWLHKNMQRYPFRYLYRFLKKLFCEYVFTRIRPDLVYINTIRKNEFSEVASNWKSHVVVHLHEMDSFVTYLTSTEWINHLTGRATHLIACAQAVADFYSTTYAVPTTKFSVLHGPVSNERFNINASMAIPTHSPMVTVGVIALASHLKGTDTFIKSSRIIVDKKKNVRFIWIGADTTGSSKKYIEAMNNLIQNEGLTKSVTLLPPTYEISDFLAGIDIFVLASRTEAFPLSILEAMLFEKPVVAMDVGGIREVVDDQTGYLVKDRTPEGLAEGILYFLENEERRQQAGRVGRQRVLEKFEAQVQAPKWIELFEMINNSA